MISVGNADANPRVLGNSLLLVQNDLSGRSLTVRSHTDE